MSEPADTQQLRAELKWLRARYDGGAVSNAAYTVIKKIETDISWAEHDARHIEVRRA
jgi:hypothetical protein